MNPDVRWNAKDDDPPLMKRKIIRGGSWKDVGYYLANRYQHLRIPGFNQILYWIPSVIDLPAAPQKGRR